MQVKTKTEPIDIPKSEELLKNKTVGTSPSTGWSWPWGKPAEQELDLTPENVKSQVTDPNVLHHIAAGERKQQLKKEQEEREECEQDTEDEETSDSDFEEPANSPTSNSTIDGKSSATIPG